MDKNFNFTTAEPRINKSWLDAGYFSAHPNPNKRPFTIIMPPPNITSRLHIGHALDLTIQDAIIRFKRMQGFEALLLPGADHAAIATEVKVTEELSKQGIDKSKLSREEFLVHIHKWYDIYMAQIVDQMKRLGLSADWNRFSFTMDERSTKAVKTVFDSLYKEGLIYQGNRMINWCPQCRTALCDAEVDHTPKSQQLFHIRFSPDIVIATVRPEVIFGDVAVAVNPGDKRYKHLVGTTVTIPLADIKIPVIADAHVDQKFGTGVLQITPAHAHIDFDIAVKNGLETPKIIDEDGKLFGPRVSRYAGLTIAEAREAVVSDLDAAGLLEKRKSHTSQVGMCYRCKSGVEPSLSNQWFVKMSGLAAPAKEALIKGELKILPKKYEKVYMHWLDNIRDWCISRQILSGHKIPIEGVEDTLDTWFSSALWPFCTLGWPDNTPEFEYFYPTQVLVTGFDILFFWVIRMVFSGLYHTDKLPFDTVVLHGLVRDKNGIKMSKSLGNGIDPIDVADEFGADALRFSLICGTRLDRDPRYGIEKAKLARNFINKIWNATKFFLAQPDNPMSFDAVSIDTKKLSTADKWILCRLEQIIRSVTRRYEKFDLGKVAADLQGFFWYEFCDWYLESIKGAADRGTALRVFGYVLLTFLKLVHPIMPFVTEELFSIIGNKEALMIQNFPTPKGKFNFSKEAAEFQNYIKTETERRAAAQANSKPAPDIAKQITVLESEIRRSEGLLGNPGFLSRAPKSLVEEERAKLASNTELLNQLRGG